MLRPSCYARFIRPLVWVTTLLTGATLGLGACQHAKDEAVAPDPTIKLATNATLGPHLVDAQGNTIYYFARDLSGTNNCTGGCASVWPAFYEASPRVGDGLSAADFTTITTSGGQPQTAYRGWPMYYYAPANASGQHVRELPGEVKGDNVGNVWFTMRPDYSLLLARTSVSNKTSGQASVKSFLIDSQGRTLYTFAIDQSSPATQSTNCSGGCITTWPVYSTAAVNLPSALKNSDFGTIIRNDGAYGAGRPQITYKGMPLYYYASDQATRNKVEGDGIGGVWAVAAP